MATREDAARYTAAAGDALTAERVALRRTEAERDEARAEAKHATECYERVCATMARMHAAALGEVRGPIVGLVEDVAAVRAERDAALAQVEAWKLASGLEVNGDPDGVTPEHLSAHLAEADTILAEVAEAVETLEHADKMLAERAAPDFHAMSEARERLLSAMGRLVRLLPESALDAHSDAEEKP